jgi:hypothetical protein
MREREWDREQPPISVRSQANKILTSTPMRPAEPRGAAEARPAADGPAEKSPDAAHAQGSPAAPRAATFVPLAQATPAASAAPTIPPGAMPPSPTISATTTPVVIPATTTPLAMPPAAGGSGGPTSAPASAPAAGVGDES